MCVMLGLVLQAISLSCIHPPQFHEKTDGSDVINWAKEQLWTAIDLQRNIFHDNNHYAVEVLEVSLYTAPMCHFFPRSGHTFN